LSQNYKWSDEFSIRLIEIAAQCGQLNIIKFLILIGVNGNYNNAMANAAENGHLDIVKFLALMPGIDLSFDNNCALYSAAKAGYFDVVQYLLTKVTINKKNDEDMLIIIKKGYHEIAKSIYENMKN
jgi:ankyrin repeat protein